MNVIVASGKDGLKLQLKAAVIYDDFDFAARAAALLERVAVSTDEGMKWDVRPWRIDALRSPSLAGAALDETLDADLIVVALGRTHQLPDELRDWLECWAARRRVEDAALLALCPEETAGPLSSWGRLKEFAEGQGLPFLGSRNLQDDGDSVDFVSRLWRWKEPVIPMVSRSADRPPAFRDWGINE